MTRSYAHAATRPLATRPRRARRATAPILTPRAPRDPSVTLLGFTCFRLIRIDDGDPGQPPFASIQLRDPTNAMTAFTRRR